MLPVLVPVVESPVVVVDVSVVESPVVVSPVVVVLVVESPVLVSPVVVPVVVVPVVVSPVVGVPVVTPWVVPSLAETPPLDVLLVGVPVVGSVVPVPASVVELDPVEPESVIAGRSPPQPASAIPTSAAPIVPRLRCIVADSRQRRPYHGPLADCATLLAVRASSLAALLACACAGAPAGPAGTTAAVTSSGDDDRWTTGLQPPTTTSGTTGDFAPPESYACDPRLQDCPAGSKCTPFSASNMGDDWDGARCVPLVEDPAGLGEPCLTQEYALSGIDDCGPGLLCWYFAAADDLRGRCLGLCREGDTCLDPGAVCYQSTKPSFLCYPLCDPLAQDCPPPATLCVRSRSVDGFLCRYPDDRPAGAGSPCATETDCAPAHVCDPADRVSGCAGERCCAPLCSLSQPDCPSELPHCEPHDDDPRERYLDVGICRAA